MIQHSHILHDEPYIQNYKHYFQSESPGDRVAPIFTIFIIIIVIIFKFEHYYYFKILSETPGDRVAPIFIIFIIFFDHYYYYYYFYYYFNYYFQKIIRDTWRQSSRQCAVGLDPLLSWRSQKPNNRACWNISAINLASFKASLWSSWSVYMLQLIWII